MPAVGLAPVGTALDFLQAPVAEPAVDDDDDLVVAGELLLQVFVKLRPVPGHDEHQLTHGF
jgi:hypothetical protein